MNGEKTYEMLWDCSFCGARKLLGLTHRHCPNCGAPQDPAKRYFPPEEEKIAVQDHQYVGQDVLCPACQTANGRLAKHCGHCGSPLEGGKAAALQQEQVIPDHVHSPSPAQAPKAKTGAKVGIGCAIGGIFGLIVLAIIGFFVLNSILKKDAGFKVVGHTWTHAVEIETYEYKKESSPCSKMPTSAERVTRQKQEPVCETRKIDQGDGTYKEKRECKDQEDICTYQVGRWVPKRSEKNTGSSVTDPMPWPTVTLSRPGECEGCEREGKKTATYTLRLQDASSGKEKTCSFSDPEKWTMCRTLFLLRILFI